MTRIEAPQHLPSVDRLVNTPAVQKFVRDHGLAWPWSHAVRRVSWRGCALGCWLVNLRIWLR